MALAKNDVYARIELEQVTVQNVIHFLSLFNCVADTASLFLFFFVFAYTRRAGLVQAVESYLTACDRKFSGSSRGLLALHRRG